MLERLGIELGAGVIPRYGLMDISAGGNCRSCGAASACTEWLGASPPLLLRLRAFLWGLKTANTRTLKAPPGAR
jgi:hypothetical protein